MARGRAPDDWPDFTRSARLQFWSLPPDVIEAFASVFPEFSRFPLRPSEKVDVCPIRNDPNRWRLRVEEYRAVYQIRQGRAIIEEILPRTGRTYKDFAAHRKRL